MFFEPVASKAADSPAFDHLGFEAFFKIDSRLTVTVAHDDDALVLADAAFKKTDVTLVMECQTGKQVSQ